MTVLTQKIVVTICFISVFVFTSIAAESCPPTMSDQKAIDIAQSSMNIWFKSIENGDLKKLNNLFAPQFVVLHSVGAPMTKKQELKLFVGFQLGGFQFSHFCAMKINDTIVATFASKTFGKDISKSKMNFLSKSKAYRLLVMKKMHDNWKIIAYANMNPIKKN